MSVTGITAAQVQGLKSAIEQGCDVKISFKSAFGDAFKETVSTCDQTYTMGNTINGISAGCISSTPLVSNMKFDKNSEFLYDEISLWTENGAVKLSKNRTAHWFTDYAPTSSSFFISNGEYQGDWQVNVFLKK